MYCWSFCAEPAITPTFAATPVLATNFVVVTNIVLVTNYVQIPIPAASITNNLSTLNSQFSTNSLLPDLSWVPPEDGFDWIQLKSGEWLKGQLKAMQQRQIEFDSEELNDLTFDWKDIRQVRSDRTLDLLFVDGRKMSGPVTVTPEEVTVGDVEPQVFPRDQLQSFTPGGSKEFNYWSGMVSLGLTVRAGNTEQVEYNAQARLQRRTPATRFSLDYIGNISSFNGVENANNTRVNSEFDLWLSRRFYLILPQLKYYRDPFQNLRPGSRPAAAPATTSLTTRIWNGTSPPGQPTSMPGLNPPSPGTRWKKARPRSCLAAASTGTSPSASN